MNNAKPETVEQYLDALTAAERKPLDELRKIIKAAAPQAKECISYAMPGYKHHGSMVFFAACKDFYSFYAVPYILDNFRDELKIFKTTKSAVNIPYSTPVPKALITRMVQFGVIENERLAAAKLAAKKAKK